MSPATSRPGPQSPPSDVGLVPHWVESSIEAAKAASSEDSRAVWIIRKANLADHVAHHVATVHPPKRTGYMMLLLNARSALLPPLAKRFKAVAFLSSALPRRELDAVLRAADRGDRLIGGVVDQQSRTVTLWRGDLTPVVVPFGAFPPTANGIRPDFEQFSVIDGGYTLKFGNYESASDAVLYEYDPEFRRRMKQARFAKEQTLGASIRRLRRQRRLTRRDFGDIDAKTLARVENGSVRRPRVETLTKIAKRLGVSPEELGCF